MARADVEGMGAHTTAEDADGRLLAAELLVSERRYRTMVDNIADVIVDSDAEGRLLFVNRAWTELTGLTLEETVDRGVFGNIHPDDHHIAMEHMSAGASGLDDGSARELRFIARDGSQRWMEVRGRALFGDDGALAGFTGIAHDVTVRREAEARVRGAAEEAERARDEAVRARDEAERASRAKSDFLSRMSHELRTPMNAILGFGQLLELGDLPETESENVDQILRAGRHLLDLINEVLDVVRIESGALVLSPEPVDVGEVVVESLDLVRHAALARGITVRSPDRHRALSALADRQRLKQILINLLSNAVKYNADHGAVVVRCAPLAGGESPPGAADAEHGWLRITVEDTGRGIDPARLHDVFSPFERVGAEMTGIEGSGIGLSVTKALVEALGGRVGVSSELGRGTAFWVDLPAASPPVGAAEGVDGRDGAPTVLYVEDNRANVTLVSRILDRRPHLRLVVAHDGPEGLEAAHREAPALVLLDLHLPTMDGAEVLLALRASPHPVTSSVPVVVVTADVSSGTEARLLAAGATVVLTKPFNVNQLLAVLDERVPAP